MIFPTFSANTATHYLVTILKICSSTFALTDTNLSTIFLFYQPSAASYQTRRRACSQRSTSFSGLHLQTPSTASISRPPPPSPLSRKKSRLQVISLACLHQTLMLSTPPMSTCTSDNRGRSQPNYRLAHRAVMRLKDMLLVVSYLSMVRRDISFEDMR